MIIATSGHVDHGKTLLVHAITGVQTDRLEEERERGLTIDLGFAYTDAGGSRLGFVDVPGHIRFINNMLAGVSVIDYALLVIAADDGPMPQTSEHLAILDLLEIDRGAVALTKIDRVEPERVAAVTADIDNLLAGTRFAGAPVFPVSSVSGAGVEALVDELARQAKLVPERSGEGHFRLAVDRCFTVKGSGVVVTGSVFSGRARVGDELLLMPQGTTVRVRGIHRQNQEAEASQPGDRCALNITAAGLTRDSIRRGNWITANTAAATNRVDAFVKLLPAQKAPLRNGTPVHVHSAANHVTGRVATLEAGQVSPGGSGLVQLVLAEPINLCRGDRLVLRDQSAMTTLGGGRVVDPVSPARGRAKPERLAYLAALREPDVRGRFGKAVELSPTGLDTTAFKLAENLTDEEWRATVDADTTVMIDRWAFTGDRSEALKQSVCTALKSWQKSNPKSSGATLNQLASALPVKLPATVFDWLLAGLVREAKVVQRGNTVALPGHEAVLSQGEANLWRRVEPILAAAPTRPPVLHDLAKQLDTSPRELEKLLIRCTQLRYVVRPTANRFFLPQGLDALRESVSEVAAASASGMFTVKQFRDATGIGRNLCIEVLEYFDRTGLTIRQGDNRKLQKQALAGEK